MRYIILSTLLILVACFPGPGIIPGPIGPSGPKGDPGLDATQITVVKFCPNSVANYPSVFPEIGLCINSKLYAVYSANNGFLVEVIPGVYQSNAIGSSCSFEVQNNCLVIPK